MTNHALAETIGWVSLTIGTVTQIPQIIKLFNPNRSREGISAATYTMWTISWVAWLTIAMRNHATPAVVSAAIGTVTCLTVLTLLTQKTPQKTFKTILLTGTATVAPLVATYILLGYTPFLVALLALDAVSVVPQLAVVYRTPPPSVEGVSVASWLLITFVAAGWTIYGILLGNVWVTGWPLFLALASVVTVRTCYLKSAVTS